MDQIIAKAEPTRTWAKASEGQVQCVLVDVIDLGMQQESYMGGPPKLKHKCALVWQIDEINPDTGKRFEMSKEFTVSMDEKANLRKFLGIWRGKSYTDEQAAEGAPLHKLYGVNGLMQIEHKQSKANPDRTYAQIVSVTQLPKGMAKLEPGQDYERSEHWSKKLAAAQDDDDTPTLDESGVFIDDLPF
jgi:hypothetical protein